MILLSIALPLFPLFDSSSAEILQNDPFKFRDSPEDLDFLIENFIYVTLYSVPSNGQIITALNAAQMYSLV